jgi:hypothetical protein
MRLWAFLEAERLDHTFRYRVFAGKHEEPATHSFPPLVALLRLGDRKDGRCLARIEAALEVIRECDSRYSVTLKASADGGGWNLHAERRRRPPITLADGVRGEGSMAPSGGAYGVQSAGLMTPPARANGGRSQDQTEEFRRSSVASSDGYAGEMLRGGEPAPEGDFLDALHRHGLDERLHAEYQARRPRDGPGSER